MIELIVENIESIYSDSNNYDNLSINIPYPIYGTDDCKLWWVMTKNIIFYIKTSETEYKRPFNIDPIDLELDSVKGYINKLLQKERLKELSKDFIFKIPSK